MTTTRSNLFFENIENIKEHYKDLTPKIMSRTARHWVAPYSCFVDFCLLFSPIEEQTWMALRCFGQVPLYPQYPVNKYFVDFGNPAVKIAIECDGKEWHLDKEKDANRDNVLAKEGWKVFRITGADCFKVCEDYHDRFDCYESDRYGILVEYYTTIEGLIKALGIFYFGYKDYSMFEDEIDLAFNCLVKYASPAQKEIITNNLSRIVCGLKDEYYEHKESGF